MKNESEVYKVSQKIRNFLHDSSILKTKIYLKKDDGFWDQLWSCLDSIDDSEIATETFQQLTPGEFLKSAYIQTFGLLQVLYVQQDSVSNLNEALFGTGIIFNGKYPEVILVRNIRNETTGHPTKNTVGKSNKYCTIDRSSLSKEGFRYLIWQGDTVTEKRAVFIELINNQGKVVLEILKSIFHKIRDLEISHKKKFRGHNLSDLLADFGLNSFELLGQMGYDVLGRQAFKHFRQKYGEIRKGIIERYGPIEKTLRIPGTKILIDDLDFIFSRLLKFSGDYETNKKDIEIFSEVLVNRLKELKTHLKEIDNEFNEK